MKLNKATYFSLFFLFCFLASFSANAFQSLNSFGFKADPIKKEAVSFSKKSRDTETNADLLSEENEDETQSAFELSAFTLPFFNSFYQFHTVLQKPVSTQLVAENPANPIYIAVHNFRI